MILFLTTREFGTHVIADKRPITNNNYQLNREGICWETVDTHCIHLNDI